MTLQISLTKQICMCELPIYPFFPNENIIQIIMLVQLFPLKLTFSEISYKIIHFQRISLNEL